MTTANKTEITDAMVERYMDASERLCRGYGAYVAPKTPDNIELVRRCLEAALNPPPEPEIEVTDEMIRAGRAAYNAAVGICGGGTNPDAARYRAMHAARPKGEWAFATCTGAYRTGVCGLGDACCMRRPARDDGDGFTRAKDAARKITIYSDMVERAANVLVLSGKLIGDPHEIVRKALEAALNPPPEPEPEPEIEVTSDMIREGECAYLMELQARGLPSQIAYRPSLASTYRAMHKARPKREPPYGGASLQGRMNVHWRKGESPNYWPHRRKDDPK